jgi:endogenous inhibitor of DNA gyrase (YacG/DUF329 family)
MEKKKLFQVPCPKCGKPAVWYDNLYRPFCSERCKILDLGAWADEGYRVPGESAEEQETTEEGTDFG